MKLKVYVPGMISLFGILPLLLWKTLPLKERFDQRVVSVFLPREVDSDDGMLTFSEEMVLREVKKKKHLSFYLNDFSEYRGEIYKRIRHTAQDIKFGYDTTSIVKVVFGENCTFEDLVSVFNICIMDEHKRWVWVKDSVFIYATERPQPLEEVNLISCGLIQYSDLAPSMWYEHGLNLFSEKGILISGYVVLVFISLWWRKNKSRG